MTSLKRGLGAVEHAAGKRTRGSSDELLRLCDLRYGADLFANQLNAVRAKEKGILRNREASAKYEELEKKLFALFRDGKELEFPDEDWCFEVMPELNNLESDTLDALLAQAQTHAKYERAARELLVSERRKLDESHEAELRRLRTELESEATRHEVSSQMRMKQREEAAHEETEGVKAEAAERIEELESHIEELEGQLEAAEAKMREVESEAEDRVTGMREEGMEALRRLREAQEETDLKRETSRKLKEEIIDNDRLTVANLNRIKHLEALVEQHKAALEEAESENEALRGELQKSVHDEDAEEEAKVLRELLEEREAQVLSLSRRLAESENASQSRRYSEGGEGNNENALGALMMRGGKRESFLDRFGLSQSRSPFSSAA